MRRKDREMSAAFGLELIRRAAFGVLALADPADPAVPYSLPLSAVLLDGKIYFHSAKAGKKTELLADGARGSFCFVTDVRVPDLFTEEELAAEVAAGRTAALLSKVFTTEYASCRVTGPLREVSAAEEWPLFRSAMYALCAKYTPDKLAWFDEAINFSRARTAVYEMTIETITAKRKRFGPDGEELKWQTMP